MLCEDDGFAKAFSASTSPVLVWLVELSLAVLSKLGFLPHFYQFLSSAPENDFSLVRWSARRCHLF